jgi:hypothetical protein
MVRQLSRGARRPGAFRAVGKQAGFRAAANRELVKVSSVNSEPNAQPKSPGDCAEVHTWVGQCDFVDVELTMTPSRARTLLLSDFIRVQELFRKAVLYNDVELGVKIFGS